MTTSSPTPLQPLGPPPFRFTPTLGTALKGPAFTLPFKLLASAVVFASAGWFGWQWLQGRTGSQPLITWFLAALALMLYTWWHMMRSVTRLDEQALYQSWVWDKKMELRELAYAKLIRVRGLDWLIAPRLYVRTLLGKFAVFYAADPVMLMEFERLVRELQAFRRGG